MYNLLYSYTKNEYTSFDLIQETYLTVNSKIGTIKDLNSVKSWINRIAINKANRFFEKNKKEILLSEVAAEMECSVGTVKSRSNYARKKIKEEVDRWEKKGTKLYGITGVSILLLYRKQLAELAVDNIYILDSPS